MVFQGAGGAVFVLVDGSSGIVVPVSGGASLDAILERVCGMSGGEV